MIETKDMVKKEKISVDAGEVVFFWEKNIFFLVQYFLIGNKMALLFHLTLLQCFILKVRLSMK